MKVTKKCFWCSGKDFVFIADRTDDIQIIQCTHCHLMQVKESPEDLEDFYTEDYYNPNHKMSEVGYDDYYTLMNPLFLLWESALLGNIVKTTKRYELLDIGCATGNLIEIINQYHHNIQSMGIDISDYAVEHCKKKGIKTEKAYIEKYRGPKSDIIVSLETLEHLDDLKTFIEGVKKNLKPEGMFLFYVPSVAKKELQDTSKIDVRLSTNLEHLIYFEPEFFKNEFENFFGNKTYVQEIVSQYGRSIVGMVTADAAAGKRFKETFMRLDSGKVLTVQKIPELVNDIILAAKFYPLPYAEQLLDELRKNKAAKSGEVAFASGIVNYHQGSLIGSSDNFVKYYEDNPIDVVALKILAANNAAYARTLLAELAEKASMPLEVSKKRRWKIR